MLDYFALLEEERRPWIDPEKIKETFHRLSREQHPDQRTPERPGKLPATMRTSPCSTWRNKP